MKQLIQNMKSGEFSMVEAPVPARSRGYVLVRTVRSLISAGTERGTVKAAQASLLGKARQKPDKVKQVLDNVKKEGVSATVKKVQEKLDEPVTLGYSSAGVVLECDHDDPRLEVGMRVACGGQNYASHAEVVVVPRNLVVPVPDGGSFEEVSFEEASFGTVGAIALQGVRRARVALGDRVLVIGLGLLGQVTWQLVRDAGAVPIGIDVSSNTVQMARDLGLKHAAVRGDDDVEGLCAALTDGHGVDSVIITAATKSKDPLELAGEVCREQGVVSVVGLVPMDFPRDPYYMKELDLVISRSYGPGRYDPSYEEKGVDYPYGHVRWTEGRNMQAVLEAIGRGTLDVKSLITHRFAFGDAISAYDIVSGKNPEPHVGIVLEYPEEIRSEKLVPVIPSGKHPAPKAGAVAISFVGAGSFARSYLLPHVKNREGVRLASVVTARGFTATDIAKKFGFAAGASDPEMVFGDSSVDAVFITTRHDSHAHLVRRALESGKHVFVEKPLVMTPRELAELVPVAQEAGKIVQTGFNRRFSPLARHVRAKLARSQGPAHVTYRVNAGPLPKDHWLNDPEVGGGRIVGEGCHFVDLMQYLTGAAPVRLKASRLGEDHDGVTTALIDFADGSTGTLIYQANAPKSVPKEHLEAFRRGYGGIIHDWKKAEVFEPGTSARRVYAKGGQAKGYAEEIEAFLKAIETGEPAITLESQVLTTAATFAILESASGGGVVEVWGPR